jgi:chromosome segregation ATPase
VDSVPIWRAARDSTARWADSVEAEADQARDRANREHQLRVAERQKRQAAEARSKAAQMALDSATATEIPANATVSDSMWWWKNRSRRQDLLILALEDENRGYREGSAGYEREIKAKDDQIRALTRLTDGLRNQVDQSHGREDLLTKTLDDLRERTKPGIKVGPVRLPGWTDEVVMVAAAGFLGCKIGGGC